MATLQLNHIARETSDVARLAAFYEAVLGFERVPSPTYSGFQVAWLRLPRSPDVALYLFERDPAAAPVAVGPGAQGAPPSQLPRCHHLAFSVADYDGFLTGLKARSTEVFEKTQQDGRSATCGLGDRRPRDDGAGRAVGDVRASRPSTSRQRSRMDGRRRAGLATIELATTEQDGRGKKDCPRWPGMRSREPEEEFSSRAREGRRRSRARDSK